MKVLVEAHPRYSDRTRTYRVGEGLTEVSVVIPAFNEEETVGDVVSGAIEVLNASHIDHEVIVVDDGSADETSAIAKKSGAKVVRNPRNLGHGAALRTGFRQADGDIIVMLDADEQNDPHDIPKVVSPLLQGKADLVIGSRYMIEQDRGFGLYRRLLDRLFVTLVRYLVGVKLSDSQSMFRAIRTDLLNQLDIRADYRISVEMIVEAQRKGLRIVEVPIKVYRRRYGASRVGVWYAAKITLSLLTSLLR